MGGRGCAGSYCAVQVPAATRPAWPEPPAHRCPSSRLGRLRGGRGAQAATTPRLLRVVGCARRGRLLRSRHHHLRMRRRPRADARSLATRECKTAVFQCPPRTALAESLRFEKMGSAMPAWWFAVWGCALRCIGHARARAARAAGSDMHAWRVFPAAPDGLVHAALSGQLLLHDVNAPTPGAGGAGTAASLSWSHHHPLLSPHAMWPARMCQARAAPTLPALHHSERPPLISGSAVPWQRPRPSRGCV
jgi:hypothetical protein